MQVIYFNNYGALIKDITMKGSVLVGDIVAARNPIEQNEIATKSYTDYLFSHLSVLLLASGIINSSSLPAFNGDVTSFPGSNTITLLNRGFQTEERLKVMVDEKGLVSGLSVIDGSDIPNLDWSKVTLDKPTTMAGYGITDGLDVSGGTVDVNITLKGNPLQQNEAASKKYVDDAAQALQSESTNPGDLILKNTAVTPVGYLLCNGGLVKIADYTPLFNKIGHIGTDPGGGYFFLPNLIADAFMGYQYYIKT